MMVELDLMESTKGVRVSYFLISGQQLTNQSLVYTTGVYKRINPFHGM